VRCGSLHFLATEAFGAIGVIALATWFFVWAIELSRDVSLPVTLTAVKDLVER
jgi:hypothetical protein